MADVLVLCYHAVSERWSDELAVSPTQLDEHLSALLARGYQGITFHRAVTSPPSRKAVAVTFDDAYRSVGELAFPVMSRLGVPGTVFVPTDFAGTERPMRWAGIEHHLGGPHERELVPMSWAELDRLTASGWEIGSHTRSHPRLTTLDDSSLATELGESRRACEERLGRPCHSLAYPYGDVDERVVEATERAGYSAAGTLPGLRFHAARPLSWPRVGLYPNDRGLRFKLKVSPTGRRLRGLPLVRA